METRFQTKNLVDAKLVSHDGERPPMGKKAIKSHHSNFNKINKHQNRSTNNFYGKMINGGKTQAKVINS